MVLFAGNTVWSITERARGVCVIQIDVTFTFTFLLEVSISQLYYSSLLCNVVV